MTGKTKKALLLTIGACLFLFAVNYMYNFVRDRTRALVLETQGLSEQNRVFLDSFLEESSMRHNRKINIVRKEDRTEQDRQSVDIHIGPWLPGNDGEDLAVLEDIPVQVLPSTVRAVGMTAEAERRAVAVALDHIEVAFRWDVFARQGLRIDERIVSLGELESVLTRLAAPGFFPLVTAGADDTALSDFFSVIVLSLEGHDGYTQLLQTLLEQPDRSRDEWEAFLNTEALQPSLDLLRQWRSSGILHNDWTAFNMDEVIRMAEQNLCAAVVMRLSAHRSWPMGALKNMQASPFPFRDPAQAGTALMAPLLALTVSADSRLAEEAVQLARLFIEQDFQKTLISQWGLGPVNASVEARDREAGDLRYWAAASRYLLSPLGSYLTPEQLTLFAEVLRYVLR